MQHINPREQKQQFYKYIVSETIRLIREADELWDLMDQAMPKEQFDQILAQYNDICDHIDYLEKWPEFAKLGHYWSLEDEKTRTPYVICPHCDRRFRLYPRSQ